VLNKILFDITGINFYFVSQEKRWVYYFSFAYAGIIIMNIIGHNRVTIISESYFEGVAGRYAGRGLA